MADVPAICNTCGLVFPSGLGARIGVIVQDCVSQCPRCHHGASVLNGYTTIINGMVTFIVSPEHSRREKILLIDMANAVAKGDIKPTEAARTLDRESNDSGKLFREWATLGFTFLATMATVASFLLAYSESKGNEEPDAVAMEKFDETLATTPQPDLTPPFDPFWSYRQQLPSSIHPKIKQMQGGAADTNPPNKNRKMRRATDKKNRTKLMK